MNNDALPKITIASPCSANWEQMTGDERVRFCGSCEKHVYNLSAMSSREGAALIRAKEGKLCVRYFLRRDGTILTQDCPVGLAAVKRQFLKVAALFVGLLASVGLGCSRENPQPLSGEPTIVEPQPQPLTGTPAPEFKGEMIMGDVAAPPTTNAPSCSVPTPDLGQAILGKVAAPPQGN